MTTHFSPANHQELQEQGDEATDNVTPEVPGPLAEAYSPGPAIGLDNTSGYEPLQSDLPRDMSPQESVSPSFSTTAGETEGDVTEQKDAPRFSNRTESFDTGNSQVSETISASVSPAHVSAAAPDRFSLGRDPPKRDLAEPAKSDVKLAAEGKASPLDSKPTFSSQQENSLSSTQSSLQDLPSSKPSKEGVAPGNHISDKARCSREGTPSPPLGSDNSALTDSPESVSADRSKSTSPERASALGAPSPSAVPNDVGGASSSTSLTGATGKEALFPKTDAYTMPEAPVITSTALPQPTTAGLVSERTVRPPQEKVESPPPPPGITTAAPISKALSTANPLENLADDNNDTNLCSGRPIDGLTTLRNGTMVVFRGHYFWTLDANRVPGPARGITEVWGIPSPIDTVFTRCSCQHKTYFFKGYRYWRFENDVMDPGYPKAISDGFGRLSGRITAALSVPQNSRRPESVFFFKRGGFMQRYSYQHGTSPSCGKKTKYMVVTVRNRQARQAEDGLDKEIKITQRGFPSFVTSAISIPTPGMTEGYDYYVFSRTKYYNVKIDGHTLALASAMTAASQQNSAKSFFKCP